jgi:hypothetical protein
MFHRHKENLSYWYNTTLLLVVLTPTQGFALWSGDGALVRSRRLGIGKPEYSEPLRSGPTTVVSNVPRLGGPIRFQGARIDVPLSLTELKLGLFTDGSEKQTEAAGRTLQQWLEHAGTTGELFRQLAADAALPKAELDNYSVAIADWGTLKAAAASRAPAQKQRLPVRKATGSLSAAQAGKLEGLARSRRIPTQWLAQLIVARAGDQEALIQEMVAVVRAVDTNPKFRTNLDVLLDQARRDPIGARREILALVDELERVVSFAKALPRLEDDGTS